MNCLICRQAEIINGFTSITFEREEFRLLIHHIPAQICPSCGEAIVTEDTATRLLDMGETAIREGMFEDIAACMDKSACSRGCFIGNLAQEMSDHHEVLRKRMSDFFGQWKACLTEYLKGWKSEGYFKKEFRPESAAEAILSAFEGSILFCKAEKNVSAVQSTKLMVIHFLKSFKAKNCCPISRVLSCFSWKKREEKK